MLEKKIAANNMVSLNTCSDGCFKVGTKYSFAGNTWTVIEELFVDNTPMRKLLGEDGVEEIVTVTTLRKDSKSKDFKLIIG